MWPDGDVSLEPPLLHPIGLGYSILMRIPIAPEGLPIIKWVWFAFLMSLLTQSVWVIGVFGGVMVFVLSFFRDPNRRRVYADTDIVAAADGVITAIKEVTVNGEAYVQIVTFLSVFNCHVNRIPLAGVVRESVHIPGQFLAAFRGDIDQKNERQETDIDTVIGCIRVVQITGAIARRICCELVANQTCKTGERFGLIRFGSRTDVYLPKNKVTLQVKKGDRVKGGLTIIATHSSH